MSMRRKYQLIYADPPWQYNDKGNAGKRGASHKYSTMELAELILLPVEKIASKNCLLAMWHVGPMPLEALAVMKAWGFRLSTMKGFTWHKLNKKSGTDFFGMGHKTRGNTEDCLFAVRGKPKIKNHSISQIIHAPVGRHSEKPEEARIRLEKLMGKVPRIELFAREKHVGWHVFGDEVKSNIIL